MTTIKDDFVNGDQVTAAYLNGHGAQTNQNTTDIAGKAAASHTHTASAISDSTTVGRNVLTAADAAAARSAIGAGTSSLALGTSSSTAKAGDYQPASTDISDSSTVGRAVLTAGSQAAARSAIGAGTGSGDVVGQASSVDSEVALFSGSGGKTIKRATGSGIAKLTSGVLGTATSGTDYAPATSGSSLLKGNGAGGFSNASAGTDYAPATSGSSILKGNGSGGTTAASAGTDYVAPGGALGTPSSGNLANCTFPTLNQNTTGSAATLTTPRTINGVSFNGSANIVLTKRVASTTSTTSWTIDADTTDIAIQTALAGALTINAPSGTPTQGQPLTGRIKDNGTARAITWNAIWRAMGITLPTTTVISKTLYFIAIYNSTDSKWDVVGLGQEA